MAGSMVGSYTLGVGILYLQCSKFTIRMAGVGRMAGSMVGSYTLGEGNSYTLGEGNSYTLGVGNSYTLGVGNSYTLGVGGSYIVGVGSMDRSYSAGVGSMGLVDKHSHYTECGDKEAEAEADNYYTGQRLKQHTNLEIHTAES